MAWYDVGKSVVCVKVGDWEDVFGNAHQGHHPGYGGVYVVTAVEPFLDDKWLKLSGFSGRYNLSNFRPVQNNNRSTETGMAILKRIASRKRQTIDAPESVEG